MKMRNQVLKACAEFSAYYAPLHPDLKVGNPRDRSRQIFIVGFRAGVAALRRELEAARWKKHYDAAAPLAAPQLDDTKD